MAKAEGKGSNTPGGVHGFPTSSSAHLKLVLVVDQGLGGAANGGGDGNAQFDDKCPAPNKEQSQESSTYHHDFTKEKTI